MALTVLITRDVVDRYRGFLASAMLEVAPGVYVSPSLSKRTRLKLWAVVSDWHTQLGGGSITLIYPDKQADGGLTVQSLGTPTYRPVRLDGILLTHRGNQ